jgi:hypothetical protein
MKLTFKQFLDEGGAATAEHHTERATQQDIDTALRFVEKHTGVAYDRLKDNLLGSTGHTLAGHRTSSGDIDIAIEEGRYDKDKLVSAMTKATGLEKAKSVGGSTYSFPVRVAADKKVQVDLMFVPSEKWARFGFHAALNSQHKGITRNLLLVNLMKRMFEKDKDVVVKGDDGEEIVRVRRGFKMDRGLERIYRVAPMRKDGKGRVALRAGTPVEVEAELKKLGRQEKFSKDPDAILDPDKAAEFMFGPGVKAKDILSAEQVIKLIFKRPDHVDIFKDTIEDLEKSDQPIPDEIKKYA